MKLRISYEMNGESVTKIATVEEIPDHLWGVCWNCDCCGCFCCEEGGWFRSRRAFRNCMRGYLKGITSVHSEWSVEEWVWFLYCFVDTLSIHLVVLEGKRWEWERWEWFRVGFGAFFCVLSVRTDFSIEKRVGIDFNESSLVSEGNGLKCRSGV